MLKLQYLLVLNTLRNSIFTHRFGRIYATLLRIYDIFNNSNVFVYVFFLNPHFSMTWECFFLSCKHFISHSLICHPSLSATFPNMDKYYFFCGIGCCHTNRETLQLFWWTTLSSTFIGFIMKVMSCWSH